MSDLLRLDPIRCDAYGHCAELLPALIELDEWGYPIIAPDEIPVHLRGDVDRAVSACPRLALSISRRD
jgi:ferredoxin